LLRAFLPHSQPANRATGNALFVLPLICPWQVLDGKFPVGVVLAARNCGGVDLCYWRAS
jgi:hypothetical protein